MEERAFLVMTYFLSNRNLNKTRTEFGKCFNVHSRKWPTKSVIQHLVRKFEATGSALDDKRGKVCAKQSARTQANIGTAQEILKATPQMSLNQAAQELGVSYSMVQRIVREDLGLHPYKLQMLQSLTPFLKQGRLTFAQTFRTHRYSLLVYYFLWGYIKDHFYQNCPITVNELKLEIERIFRKFNEKILLRVIGNFLTRLDTVQFFIKFSYFFCFNKFP